MSEIKVFTDEELILARRQLAKKWRDKNRDKVKKYQDNYILKRAEKLKEVNQSESK